MSHLEEKAAFYLCFLSHLCRSEEHIVSEELQIILNLKLIRGSNYEASISVSMSPNNIMFLLSYLSRADLAVRTSGRSQESDFVTWKRTRLQ